MGNIDQLFIERDVDLVEQCLGGNVEAIEELKSLHEDSFRHLLFSYRSTEDEAEEIIAQLWVDCLTHQPPGLPLLMRYNGRATLKSWLGAIVVNRWLSLKRRQATHSRVVSKLQAAAESESPNDSLVDLELLQLLAASLQKGLQGCSDEDIVLLHLVHLHELTQREVANLWKVHESQISRKLRAAEAHIAETTLRELRQSDEQLEITWKDFIRLCESTNLLLT